MNWAWAAAAPVLVGLAFVATGHVHPAILGYHVLCGVAVVLHRERIRPFLRWGRSIVPWALGTTVVIVAFLLVAPLVHDPKPYRFLFRSTLFPWGDPPTMFALFAAYTMVVHVPLEEIFWRGVAMDPGRSPLRTAVLGNAFGFYLLHAVPMTMILGPEGLLAALPAGAAGGVWAFVTIRSRSLWPGLVSHWGADAVILGGMWFFFVR